MDFFDLHCDTAYECYVNKKDFYSDSLAVSAQSASSFGNWTQTFAVWIKDTCENPFSLYRNILGSFKATLKTKPKNLTPLFSVEGGAVIENDSDRLFILKQDEIKFLSLTWNGENLLAGGTACEKSLTPLGKEVINKMNRLKIGCDLSHLNRKSFFKALEYSDYPLCTHSNLCEIKNHSRNLTDTQINALVQKGGIIGLCFYPDFLKADVFEGIWQNIFHLLSKGFEDNIAIGSDFDGGKMSPILQNSAQIPTLYSFLESKGLKKEVLDKIFSLNANKFIAKLK